MSSNTLRQLRVCALLAALPVAAHAQIWRCEGPGGVVEYSNSPASGRDARCRTVDLPSITTIPAPRLPAGAASAPAPAPANPARTGAASPAAAPGPGGTASAAPAGFPRVDTAAQRTRDLDRRRILEDELRKEESRLSGLRAEFNGGEPERRGDERNFQRYLDRVQRLKDEIARSESSVASLRREMAALRD
jgi:hypothetical protein